MKTISIVVNFKSYLTRSDIPTDNSEYKEFFVVQAQYFSLEIIA